MDANLHGAGLAAIGQTELRPDWLLVVAPAAKDWSALQVAKVAALTKASIAAALLFQSGFTGP